MNANRCPHPELVERARSNGVPVVRCARCDVLRSINKVTILGGAFSGDQRRIAELTRADVADLIAAFETDPL